MVKYFLSTLVVIIFMAGFLMISRDHERAFVEKYGNDFLTDFGEFTKKEFTLGAIQIEKEKWPEHWEDQVSSIRMYMNGVFIQTSEGGRYNRGVFVSWEWEVPYSGSGIEFQRIEDRIYSYKEKVRVPAQ